MMNFSIVGRNATMKERKEYEEYDKENKEREKIVAKLSEKHPTLDFVNGGAVSIDIFNKGHDKGQVIKHFVDKLKDVFKFKFFSFLQPIVYDIIENNPDRYLHIKGFYNNLKLSRYKNIIDISKSTNLVKENFIDWQHLDGDGNKKIAETIFEKIKNEI